MLAWPAEQKVTIKSLALNNPLFQKKISRVELLGYGKIPFKRTTEGLIVTLPAKRLNDIAPVIKIRK